METITTCKCSLYSCPLSAVPVYHIDLCLFGKITIGGGVCPLQRYNGSSMLLKNIELYGQYLAESLTSPVIDTTRYNVNGIMLTEPNIGEWNHQAESITGKL